MKDWEKRLIEREVKIALPHFTVEWLMQQDTSTIIYYFRLLFASNKISDAAKAEAAKILKNILAKNPRVSADDYVLFNTALEIASYMGVR
jgi:hypothetical protein